MKKRFEGRNLDEALDNAARGFGVERFRLAYHVVLEKRGFLGGMKRVVIEADVNDAATPPVELEEEAQPTGPIEEYSFAREIAQGPSRQRGPRGGRRRERGRRGARGRGGFPEHRREREQPRLERDRGPREPVPEQGPQSEDAARVREWCEELIDRAGLQLDVRTTEDEEQIRVTLYGPDARLVVGHGGELLDSLQVLVNKGLVGRTVSKPVEIDCRSFKEQRAEELARRARLVADRVRRDGREEILEAMSPVERRIIHVALQDDGEVATESRGEGFYKRIAIVRRKQEEPTPQQEEPSPAEP